MSEHVKHTLRNFILGLVLLCASAATAYYLKNNPPKAQREKPPQATFQVESMTAKPQNYTVEIDSYGTIQARTRGTLTAQISGEIIDVADKFRAGSFFEKDDLLLQIDQRDFETNLINAQANVSQAQATVAQEKAQAEQASRDWQRLGNKGKAPDLVLRKPQLSAASAQLEWNKAALEKAKLDLARTQITAPYAGRIISKNVDLGQYVTLGTELGEIFAIDYVEVRLPLTSHDYSQIEIVESYRGENIIATAENSPAVKIISNVGEQEYIFEGYISRTEGVFDTTTRQTYVVANVDDPYGKRNNNTPPLKIGQFVTARIKGKELNNVFVIPNHAVYQGSYLFVVEDGIIQRRQVKLVWQDDLSSIVSEGLHADEIVVTTPLNDTVSGTRVKIKAP